MNPDRRNTYDFRMYRKLKPLFEYIYFGLKSIDAFGRDQQLFEQQLEELDNYRPRTEPNITNRRQMIIDAFENRLFPTSNGNYYQRGDSREDTSDSDDSDDGVNGGNNGNNDDNNGGNNNLSRSSGTRKKILSTEARINNRRKDAFKK